MSCVECGKSLPEEGTIVLNIDGDIACSEKCAISYKQKRDNFFNTVIHDDNLFSNWLCSDVDDLCKRTIEEMLTQ